MTEGPAGRNPTHPASRGRLATARKQYEAPTRPPPGPGGEVSVVFLVRTLDYGGAEWQVVETCKWLARGGCRVAVAVFYPGGALEPELREAGVRILSLEKKGRWDVFGFLARTVGVLRRERAEVLYSYLVVPNIISVLLKTVLRRMRVVWGVRASYVDYRRYDRLSRLSFTLSGVLARFADAIVVNSEAGRRFHVAHGYPQTRMTVIPNGIDVERFRPDQRLGREVRAGWGVMPEVPLVGLVGRLDPMKDHPTFLQAAARLCRERPDVRFACVGEGPDRYGRKLRELAAGLNLSGRLIWAGARADMPAVYNALDVLVLSSAFGEGFPNVVGEAMACAVPCVVTDVGDCRRIVGDAGLVVPSGDAEALSACLRAVLADSSASERGRSARGRVVAEFSVPHMVEATLDVLRVRPTRG